MDLARNFTNKGVTTWNAGAIHFRGGSKFSNAAGGTFEVNFGASVFYDMVYNVATPQNTFENDGIIKVSFAQT
jgi:hypothetical protein